MFGFTNQGSLFPMIGIDFGSQTIKAVVISGRPGRFQIDACIEVLTPKGSLVDYQMQDVEKISQSVKQLVKLLPSRLRFAATAVSGSPESWTTMPKKASACRRLFFNIRATRPSTG